MEQVYKRLESLETLGIKFGLENIRALLSALSDPQDRFRSILIAGTNGKGSVGAMLEEILIQNGYCTGYYLSPHLVDVRERIRIQGKKISEDDFAKCLSVVFQATDEIEILSTYFETLTAAAMLHFAEQEIDSAVVEVGLGGRYDATNVLKQNLSVLTSIGLDHESLLGNTIPKITEEKAAISKNDVPMVTGPLPADAMEVVDRVCAETKSKRFTVNLSDAINPELQNGFPVFFYRPWNLEIKVGLRGKHQIQNSLIALLSADILKEEGWKLDRAKTLTALQTVRWGGRLELLAGYEPPLLLDCAHNPMGVQSLVQFLEDMRWNRVVCLFTAMKDKNISGMFSTIAPCLEHAVLTRVEPLQRCATAEQLTAAASQENVPFTLISDAETALKEAMDISKRAGLPLVVFGSIYLIGRILSLRGRT